VKRVRLRRRRDGDPWGFSRAMLRATNMSMAMAAEGSFLLNSYVFTVFEKIVNLPIYRMKYLHSKGTIDKRKI
jgi:hypothetical protein